MSGGVLVGTATIGDMRGDDPGPVVLDGGVVHVLADDLRGLVSVPLLALGEGTAVWWVGAPEVLPRRLGIARLEGQRYSRSVAVASAA